MNTCEIKSVIQYMFVPVPLHTVWLSVTEFNCSVSLHQDCLNRHLPGNVKSIKENIKGKAIPLQAWTGPEGSRRLRLPDFKTIGT